MKNFLDGNVKAEFWRRTLYDNIMDKLEALPDGEGPDFETYGLREPCVLNKLEAFHAVDSIAQDVLHDYCEGLGCYDAAYILKVYIKVHKAFTIEEYNQILRSMKFTGQDARDRPQPLKNVPIGQLEKLPGKAIAVMVTIRYLPSIIRMLVHGERDLQADDVFQLLLKLHELQELILAEEIPVEALPHYQDVVNEYFQLR